jgi:hypothetical protein
MSIISRVVSQYIARNRSTFDPAQRDDLIAFAEQVGLQESIGSQGKSWHLSDATLEQFATRVQQSRPDLLAKTATQAPATHINTSSDVAGEVRILAGDYFDRLPPAERLRLSNSHNVLGADDGTVTLRRR